MDNEHDHGIRIKLYPDELSALVTMINRYLASDLAPEDDRDILYGIADEVKDVALNYAE